MTWRSRRCFGVVCVVLLALGCSSSTSPEPAPPTLADDLQQMLDAQVAEVGAPGATLTVSLPGQPLWGFATGMADIEGGRAMVPEDRFGIGSITKTFTAAVVLQLRDEGVLSLDDTLERWYPGYPRGELITLEHLLRHMTGIYDVAYHPEVVGDPSRDWEPEALVALTASEPPLFEPGQDYSYSNTNYFLLGLVTEAATGNTWEHEVRSRLLDPLALGDTFLPTVEVPTGGLDGVAHGYFVSDDWTEHMSPTTGWSAGSMLSNGPDLVAWLAALLLGSVLSEASREEMKTPTELPDGRLYGYGLGLVLRSHDDGFANKPGHDGDAIIYRADAFYLPAQDISVVALVNAFPHEARPIADATWEIVLAAP